MSGFKSSVTDYAELQKRRRELYPPELLKPKEPVVPEEFDGGPLPDPGPNYDYGCLTIPNKEEWEMLWH